MFYSMHPNKVACVWNSQIAPQPFNIFNFGNGVFEVEASPLLFQTKTSMCPNGSNLNSLHGRIDFHNSHLSLNFLCRCVSGSVSIGGCPQSPLRWRVLTPVFLSFVSAWLDMNCKETVLKLLTNYETRNCKLELCHSLTHLLTYLLTFPFAGLALLCGPAKNCWEMVWGTQ